MTTATNPRVNFGKIKKTVEYPDLLNIQVQSFEEFFQIDTTPDERGVEGLHRVFSENYPITDASQGILL